MKDNGFRKRGADEISHDETVSGAPADNNTEDTTSVAAVTAADKNDAVVSEKESEMDKNATKNDEAHVQQAGFTKDAGAPPTSDAASEKEADAPSNTAGSTAFQPNPYDVLRYSIVRNDGKPESMVKLVGLKSLFAKQLPKMPRAYIARLVFDRRHTSLAILSDNPDLKDSDEEIVGGICYRAFPEMRFAGEDSDYSFG